VTGGGVNEVTDGLSGVDHESVGELHGLGTGSTELSGNDDLTSLGTGLHDETEDSVACTTDSKTVKELVAEGLALSDSAETTVLDLGGVEGDRVLGELETLLDEGGELADAAALVSEDLLGVGGTDD
jgi:ribose 5-phosphate isomerase